jgi:hypothetical protein
MEEWSSPVQMAMADWSGMKLRPYQQDAVTAFQTGTGEHNMVVIMPTNSGKTIIAAEVMAQTLDAEPEKMVVFLAPRGNLVEQQADRLLQYDGRLRPGPDDASPRRRLCVCCGGLPDASVRWDVAARGCQVIVSTPDLFERALMHADIRMADIALIIFDEVHHLIGDAAYAIIMRHFYWAAAAAARPRVLGLTATPVDGPADTEPSVDLVREGLAHLLARLDARPFCSPLLAASPPVHRIPFTPHARSSGPAAALVQQIDAAMQTARPGGRDEPGAGRAFPSVSAVGFDTGESPVAASIDREWRRLEAVVTDVARQLGAWACWRAAHLIHEAIDQPVAQRVFWVCATGAEAAGSGGIDEAGGAAAGHADAAGGVCGACGDAGGGSAGVDDRAAATERLWLKARSALGEALQGVRAPQLTDPGMMSTKVEVLVKALAAEGEDGSGGVGGGVGGGMGGGVGPRGTECKAGGEWRDTSRVQNGVGGGRDFDDDPSRACRTLIFTHRRQVCSLLSEMLTHLLPARMLPCRAVVGSSGRDARSGTRVRGAASDAKAHGVAFDALREGSLKTIVCTAVADEGIDVAQCGRVVRFDPPRSFREHAQSSGRARAEGATILALVADGGRGIDEGWGGPAQGLRGQAEGPGDGDFASDGDGRAEHAGYGEPSCCGENDERRDGVEMSRWLRLMEWERPVQAVLLEADQARRNLAGDRSAVNGDAPAVNGGANGGAPVNGGALAPSGSGGDACIWSEGGEGCGAGFGGGQGSAGVSSDAGDKTCELRALRVLSSGALLPPERAVAFLKDVYRERVSYGHGTLAKANYALGAVGFGDKSFVFTPADPSVNAGATGVCCQLTLPRVGLCAVQPRAWEGARPPTAAFPTKELAAQQAALEACDYLLATGVLDDRLRVAGRREMREEVLRRERGRGGKDKKSTTRLGAYERHTKQPFVRRLPRCLGGGETGRDGGEGGVGQSGAAAAAAVRAVACGVGLTVGGGAGSKGSRADAQATWWHQAWLTTLTLGGDQSTIALLLHTRVDLSFTIHAPEPVRVLLRGVRRVALQPEQASRLSRWLVGSLDLVQGGASGQGDDRLCEPLHPSLGAPRRLLSFDHRLGTYIPDPVWGGAEALAGGAASSGGGATAASDAGVAAALCLDTAMAWAGRREVARRSGTCEEEALAALLGEVAGSAGEVGALATGSAAAGAAVTRPAAAPQRPVIVLDLDGTLWRGCCDDLRGSAQPGLEHIHPGLDAGSAVGGGSGGIGGDSGSGEAGGGEGSSGSGRAAGATDCILGNCGGGHCGANNSGGDNCGGGDCGGVAGAFPQLEYDAAEECVWCPASQRSLYLFEGVRMAIGAIRRAGFRLAVASLVTAEAAHATLHAFGLDGAFVCVEAGRARVGGHRGLKLPHLRAVVEAVRAEPRDLLAFDDTLAHVQAAIGFG